MATVARVMMYQGLGLASFLSLIRCFTAKTSHSCLVPFKVKSTQNVQIWMNFLGNLAIILSTCVHDWNATKAAACKTRLLNSNSNTLPLFETWECNDFQSEGSTTINLKHIRISYELCLLYIVCSLVFYTCADAENRLQQQQNALFIQIIKLLL